MTKVGKIPVLIKLAFMVEKAPEIRSNKQSVMYVGGRGENNRSGCAG